MKNLAAASMLLFAACTDSNDGTFHVTGRVEGGATHVIAAAADQQSIVRKLDTDGSFDLPLAPKHAWVVSVVDTTRLVATLQTGTLDTLAPMAPGAVDLGQLTVAVGVATPAASYDSIIGALGLDAATAARIGARDDFATRLATPDVDGNGKIDALESGHGFALEVHGDLRLVSNGKRVTVSDLLQVTPPVYEYQYLGTGLQVSLPKTFTMSAMTAASLTFEDNFFGTSQGPDTPMVPAGTPVREPELLTGAFESHPIAGVVANPAEDVPQGTYTFAASGAKLRFESVHAPSADQLTSGEGMIVPFIRIIPTADNCTYDCGVSAIEYRWMQRTNGAWQPAPDAERSLMTDARVDISRLASTGTMQDLYVTIPTAAATGLLDWQTDVHHDGILANDLAGVTTSQICYVSASFQDLVGMRLISSVSNTSGGCQGH